MNAHTHRYDRDFEMNEAMRRPMSSGFAIMRILFAYFSYAFCVNHVPQSLVVLWGVFWAGAFLKDFVTGLTPGQTIFGFLFNSAGWLLWIVMMGTAVMGA